MRMLSTHLPSTKTLQCFLAVAQEQNFRIAAEVLNMSQPPLTRQIQGLEDLLRVKLFIRDTRRVSLTPAGEVFKNETHKFLLALDLAVTGIKEHFHDKHEAADAVRIGLTSVINISSIINLDDLINDPDFAAARAVERNLSKNLVERVRRGELDLAIVGDIITPPDDLTVESLKYREPMIVIMQESHPAASKKVVSLRELGDTPLFWFARTDNPAFYDKCERIFNIHGYIPPRRLEPKDFTLLLASIAAGEGIAMCPQSMQAISRTGVAFRPLPEKLLDIDVQLVWRTEETRQAVLDKTDAIRLVFTGVAKYPPRING